MDWREKDGVRWLEAELPGARAAFSTRVGGVSDGDFASLNLGILTEDDSDKVRENRRRLSGAIDLGAERIVIGRQVHGTEIESHDGPQSPAPFAEPGSSIPNVDGHILRRGAERPVAGLVFVADCLPVVLAGAEGIAVLHCGWRGLAGGIIAAGASAVRATAAAIGPGVGRCCYGVGPEVLGAFDGLSDDGATGEIADGRMLDLPEVARRLLSRAGVSQVESAGLCTSCNPDLFFSHRRDDGRTGRQAGLGWFEGD